MSAWLAAYIGAVIGFALGWIAVGRVSESEYDAKLRADWNQHLRDKAEKKLAQAERGRA